MILLNNDIRYLGVVVKTENNVGASAAQQPNPSRVTMNELDNCHQDTVTLSSAAKRSQETVTLQTANTYGQLASDKIRQYDQHETVNKEATSSTDESKSGSKERYSLQDAMQAILDKHTGIDRKKLEEIEAKIAEIANDKNLSQEQKAEQIELLQQQKEQMLKDFIEINEQQRKKLEQ
ncbi:hypothetical protein HQQ94_16290 [Shewanella sp. VB17]|uniref:hypothetical protein n=1 Tax=Shewanella sp. VB17 TaxID=2739432 RepID=UPI001565C468|nr:hypothetical protein [Shewanella sp. VB17]NRD74750.1 hypothetical protein [Shewanella sp. VB17]